MEDLWVWVPGTTGDANTKSIYKFLRGETKQDWTSWKKMWELPVAPRVRGFLWKLFREQVPTWEYLYGLRCGPKMNCEMCGIFPETGTHLFYACRFALEMWVSLARELEEEQWQDFRVGSEWITQTWSMDQARDTLIKTAIAATIWEIWKARNARVFQDRRIGAYAIARKAAALAQEYMQVAEVARRPVNL
ncbi:uncharacterized protein [Typha latifolia]|uniref:uncharacterized protein n=1 Tax=Typha latifolia TaxID=4733 RepID=UPI003C3011C4